MLTYLQTALGLLFHKQTLNYPRINLETHLFKVLLIICFRKRKPRANTGGRSCVCWDSGKGAFQLLESQWGDYSAWVA